MKIVLVHGFNIRDGGAKTVDRLVPFIRNEAWQVDVDEGDYGFFNIWMIRMVKSYFRSRVLYRLAKAFETADVIITHSNGANFTNQALDMLGPEHNNKKIVVHISPALNAKTEPPAAVKAQLVLYTRYDGWVKLSSYIPFHPWGRMGAVGFKGRSNKVRSIEKREVKQHSAWFEPRFAFPVTWKASLNFIKENI